MDFYDTDARPVKVVAGVVTMREDARPHVAELAGSAVEVEGPDLRPSVSPLAARPLLQVLRAVARDALALGVGATLPTSVHYQRSLGVGAGTVQRALGLLEERGALRATSRGHLGRVIGELDVGAAWQTAGLDAVRLVLPQGGSPEADVLSQVLAEQLTRHGIPHTAHHVRGSSRRLASVLAGSYDLSVVSAGAAGGARGEVPPLVRTLQPGTYYAPGQLVVVHRSGTPPRRRIAIDRSSPDHATFTEAEFPSDAGFEHVPVPFPRVPAAVLAGTVDAGIWHVTRTVIPLDLAGLALAPLGREEAQAALDALSAAVLVGSASRPELAALLSELSFGDLLRRQRAAIDESEEASW